MTRLRNDINWISDENISKNERSVRSRITDMRKREIIWT